MLQESGIAFSSGTLMESYGFCCGTKPRCSVGTGANAVLNCCASTLAVVLAFASCAQSPLDVGKINLRNKILKFLFFTVGLTPKLGEEIKPLLQEGPSTTLGTLVEAGCASGVSKADAVVQSKVLVWVPDLFRSCPESHQAKRQNRKQTEHLAHHTSM